MFYQSVVAALIICSSGVLAQDTIVYRWVDNNNVVHYSHEHPADKDYSEVKVHVAYTAPINKPSDDNLKQESKPETNNESLSTEEITKNCEAAQVNLKVLNSFERITVTDEDGSVRLLTDEEKQEQVEISHKYVDVYCESAQRLSKNTG